MSDIAACSDETFVLLTLENNCTRRKDEAAWLMRNKDKVDIDREKKHFAPSKYTNSGKSQANGRSRPFQGWAREGYVRFNALYQLVAADRRTRAAFEKDLMASYRSSVAHEQADIESEEEEDDIYPANDLAGGVEQSLLGLGVARDRGAMRADAGSDSDSTDPYDDTPRVN